jgi:hypothetical protein
MSDKRLFQILDEMNVADIQNKTKFVSLFPDMVNVQQTRNGIHITMGAPLGSIDMGAIAMGSNKKQRIVLMVIDGEEYDKRTIKN